MNLEVGPIDLKKFIELEKSIKNTFVDRSKIFEVWESLDNYFAKTDAKKDHEHFFTYFRLYSSLTLKNFYALEPAQVIVKVIGRQVLLAVLLDFDLIEMIKVYLKNTAIDAEHMGRIYDEMKSALINSEELLGTSDSQPYIIKDLVKELSVGSAYLNSELKKNIVKKISLILESNGKGEMSESFGVGLFDAATKLIDVVVFFLSTSSKNLSLFESMPTPKKDNSMPKPEKVATSNSRVVSAPQALVNPSAVIEKTDEKTEENQKKYSYSEIRKRVENSFAKDNGGNFLNITDVLGELQKISAMQGDPRIKDLYIFNEEKGRFEWNEKMFNK